MKTIISILMFFSAVDAFSCMGPQPDASEQLKLKKQAVTSLVKAYNGAKVLINPEGFYGGMRGDCQAKTVYGKYTAKKGSCSVQGTFSYTISDSIVGGLYKQETASSGCN